MSGQLRPGPMKEELEDGQIHEFDSVPVHPSKRRRYEEDYSDPILRPSLPVKEGDLNKPLEPTCGEEYLWVVRMQDERLPCFVSSMPWVEPKIGEHRYDPLPNASLDPSKDWIKDYIHLFHHSPNTESCPDNIQRFPRFDEENKWRNLIYPDYDLGDTSISIVLDTQCTVESLHGNILNFSTAKNQLSDTPTQSHGTDSNLSVSYSNLKDQSISQVQHKIIDTVPNVDVNDSVSYGLENNIENLKNPHLEPKVIVKNLNEDPVNLSLNPNLLRNSFGGNHHAMVRVAEGFKFAKPSSNVQNMQKNDHDSNHNSLNEFDGQKSFDKFHLLTQRQLNLLISFHLRWLDTIDACSYTVLVQILRHLDKHISSRQTSNLRQLARLCASFRTGRVPEDPIVFYINGIISIISTVFGQKDLLPNQLLVRFFSNLSPN